MWEEKGRKASIEKWDMRSETCKVNLIGQGNKSYGK